MHVVLIFKLRLSCSPQVLLPYLKGLGLHLLNEEEQVYNNFIISFIINFNPVPFWKAIKKNPR